MIKDTTFTGIEVIGLTGGIGSGKSTAVDYLEDLGFEIISADKIARQIVERGSPYLNRLVKVFGDEILDEEGCLKRKVLGEKAFSSRERTALLDSIMLEGIRNIIVDRIAKIRKEFVNDSLTGKRGVFIEAPLLFEAKLEEFLDESWLITASEEERIKRVMARDSISEKETLDIINKQMPEAEKKQRADAVIENTGTKTDLTEKIKVLLKKRGMKYE